MDPKTHVLCANHLRDQLLPQPRMDTAAMWMLRGIWVNTRKEKVRNGSEYKVEMKIEDKLKGRPTKKLGHIHPLQVDKRSGLKEVIDHLAQGRMAEKPTKCWPQHLVNNWFKWSIYSVTTNDCVIQVLWWDWITAHMLNLKGKVCIFMHIGGQMQKLICKQKKSTTIKN